MVFTAAGTFALYFSMFSGWRLYVQFAFSVFAELNKQVFSFDPKEVGYTLDGF